MSEGVRIEEPWTADREEYIRSLGVVAQNQADLHNAAGYHFNKQRGIWVLPALALPIIMAGANTIIAEYEYAYIINAVFFTFIGLLNSFNEFKGWTKKRGYHFNYAGRWSNVAADITADLQHGGGWRAPYDVCSTRIHMVIRNVQMNEPMIPAFISRRDNAADMEPMPV